MPTAQQIAFFESNKVEVGTLIERTNVKRATKGQPSLTSTEIDDGIDEMISLKANNKPITSFQFPEPAVSNTPIKLVPPHKESIQGERFNFEIIKLGNGFVLNLSQGKSFIFKTREELSEIFDEILFEEKEIIIEGIDGRKKTKKV